MVHGAVGPAAKGAPLKGDGRHLCCRGDKPCKPGPDTSNGWGDSDGIAVDPVDERLIWTHGATAPTGGNFLVLAT